MSKTTVRQRKPESKEPTVAETFSKAITAEADWSDKDEFLDVVYWLRQIIGVIIGVIWGIVPLKGIVGILFLYTQSLKSKRAPPDNIFFAINTLIVYIYFNSFQRVDEEEYGGITEILKEGLMTSFSSFMVSWIILYSAIHFD